MAEAVMTSAAPDSGGKKKQSHPRDPAREAVETIVFVVVLVLLLKLFVTEAFVIPTGSMAETLYGYQKIITCPKCGHEFPVNSHDEVEGNQATKRRGKLFEYTCPNCRYEGSVDDLKPIPGNESGDRVLVLKPIYHVQPPARGDVVVFKYPEKPQLDQVAQNYIKRAMAFGGETVGIHRGDLFVTRSLQYPPDQYPHPENPNDLWEREYRYMNNQMAADLFEKSRAANFSGQVAGGFGIVRKTEEQVLACRRVVWDNDKQPGDLAQNNIPPRWYAPPEAGSKWSEDDARLPRAFTHSDGGLDWIRYRHLAWSEAKEADGKVKVDPETGTVKRTPWIWSKTSPLSQPDPGPIDNFLGYNAGVTGDPSRRPSKDDDDFFRDANSRPAYEHNWVGDLILECEAEMGNGAAVVLELSKGQNRFQARFGNGQVSLSSTGPGAVNFGSRPCKVNGAGKYQLRFANVDSRLRVWVNNRLVDFGTDADYPPGSTVPTGWAQRKPGDHWKPGEVRADPEGWTEENDVAAPASVGAQGAATIRKIRLDRDIYYTREYVAAYQKKGRSSWEGKNADPDSWVKHSQAELYYVQPGHYFCLGDNSAQSSDSRTWGLVPERLLLGKAVFVFYPVWRVGFIK